MKQMKTDTLSKAVTQVTKTNNGVKMSIYLDHNWYTNMETGAKRTP